MWQGRQRDFVSFVLLYTGASSNSKQCLVCFHLGPTGNGKVFLFYLNHLLFWLFHLPAGLIGFTTLVFSSRWQSWSCQVGGASPDSDACVRS